MHLLIFPHRTPKLISSQCNCTGSWPFSLHAHTGRCIIPAHSRRHTVKQRGLPQAWNSPKFYPKTLAEPIDKISLNPCKIYRLKLQTKSVDSYSRLLPKCRKKMEELHVYKLQEYSLFIF